MSSEGIIDNIAQINGFDSSQVNPGIAAGFDAVAQSIGAPVIAAPYTALFTPGGAFFGIVNLPMGWDYSKGFPSGYNVGYDSMTGVSTVYGPDFTTVMGFMISPNANPISTYELTIFEDPVDGLTYGYTEINGSVISLPMASNYASVSGFQMQGAGYVAPYSLAGRGPGDGSEGGPNR